MRQYIFQCVYLNVCVWGGFSFTILYLDTLCVSITYNCKTRPNFGRRTWGVKQRFKSNVSIDIRNENTVWNAVHRGAVETDRIQHAWLVLFSD